MLSGVAQAPETGRPNPTFMAPTLAGCRKPAAPPVWLATSHDRRYGMVSAGHLPDTSGLARTVEVAVPPNLAKSASAAGSHLPGRASAEPATWTSGERVGIAARCCHAPRPGGDDRSGAGPGRGACAPEGGGAQAVEGGAGQGGEQQGSAVAQAAGTGIAAGHAG